LFPLRITGFVRKEFQVPCASARSEGGMGRAVRVWRHPPGIGLHAEVRPRRANAGVGGACSCRHLMRSPGIAATAFDRMTPEVQAGVPVKEI
jgi:hypothetical protein